jgi:lipopolysaccharide/colanic/teichoic acid biosynthesis glycosyltransferase
VTGFVADPAPYYALMDVVALPTYREGYPIVALEAAAAGRPFVTTCVTGAAEAVADGETGLLVPARDSGALAEAVGALLDDPACAAAMAQLARSRVVAKFSQERVWRAFEEIYRGLLRARSGNDAIPRDQIHEVPGEGLGAKVSQDLPQDPSCQFWSPWARSRPKRAFDLAVSLLGLILAAPLLALAAGLIALTMGRPILFRQPRAGQGGRPFVIHKFRTMTVAAGRAERSADRLTVVGRLLRRWSIDELPQLWNVLAGEMSLVGPRPLPLRYEPRYTARQRQRLAVRPGITGWAQVHGRNSLSWEQRFDLDVWYVEHASMRLDLQILARSVAIVVSGSGVSPQGAAIMPEFLGETRHSV